MMLLPMAALVFTAGGAMLFSVLLILRSAGAFDRQSAKPAWLPLTEAGVFGRWGDARRTCAARRDPVYHAGNLGLVAVGAVGLAFSSSGSWVGVVCPVAYVGAGLIFFFGLYSTWACEACYYVREADTPLPLYRATREGAFKLRYRSAILTWYLLLWVWPMTFMVHAVWIEEDIRVAYPLGVMILLSALIFAPTLAIRVCKICRINLVGMCPMPWKGLVAPRGVALDADRRKLSHR